MHDYIRKLQGTSIYFVIFKNDVCRKSKHESYKKRTEFSSARGKEETFRKPFVVKKI